jgi:hypothetical protein
VNESTRVILILILAFLILIAVAFLMSNYLVRKAIREIIKAFRDNQALTPESAKTMDDLGFKRRSFLQIRALRDYKPSALQLLMRNNIILATEDGRFFLSEEQLSQTTLEKRNT